MPFFPHIYNGMSKGFSKMYVLSFFGEKTFLRTFFYYITGFCKKKYNFCYFLHILKVKQFQWCINCHISTSNMWFWEGGGGQINPPPQCKLVFKYPSRNRIKIYELERLFFNLNINWKRTHNLSDLMQLNNMSSCVHI